MDSDDALTLFSDDDDDDFQVCIDGLQNEDFSDDATMGEAMFQLYKKHKINKLKRRIGSCFCKRNSNVKRCFSQLSFKCFSDLVNALSSDQIGVIESFGFGSVLSFGNCAVPKRFVRWICSIVDARTSELIFKDRIIPFNKQSVNKILGLPIGGEALVGEFEAGKTFLSSKFGIDNVESIEFFAEKLTGSYDMTDEEVFICFMIVAIGCFLCPSSSYEPMIQLLHIFEHPIEVRKYDWSQFLYDLCLDYVRKIQKQLWKPNSDSIVFCSSSYLLAVLYLDCVNFGSYHICSEIPRTSFWKASVVKFCSELDEVKFGKYGRRPLKLVIDTSYSETVEEVLANPVLSQSFVAQFKSKLESLYGHVLPEELKLGICKIYATHCVEESKRSERGSEDLLFKIFSFCNELSEKVKYEHSICQQTSTHVATPLVNGEVQLNVCPQNLCDNIEQAACGQFVVEDHIGGDSVDLSLKLRPNAASLGCLPPNVEVVSSPNLGHNKIQCSDLELPECDVQDKIKFEASDLLNIGGHPNPVLQLSTPAFMNGRNNCSAGPSMLIVDAPIVKQKIIAKGHIETKPAILDLNKCSYDCEFGTEKYVTPKDYVIDVDSAEFIAANKAPLPSGHSQLPCNSRDFPYAPELVFDVDTQQYVRVRKEVAKGKFVSKSGSFLSKLQIADLNVPLMQSEESTPINVKNVPKVVAGSSNFNSKATGHVQSMSKCAGSVKNSEHVVSNVKVPVGSSKDFVCLGDTGDQAHLTVPIIDLDEEKEKHIEVSTDVQIIGELSFRNKIRSMCEESEILYNKTVDAGPSVLNHVHAAQSVLVTDAKDSTFVRAAFDRPSFCRPQSWSLKFVLTDKDRRNYLAACRLASSTKWKEEIAVEIGGCFIKYKELEAGLLNGSGSISYVKKCFDGAASVLALHKADMLFFPICHDEHWFVFVVDFRNSLFVFLDSYFSGDAEYHTFVRDNLIPSFKSLWHELVGGPTDFEKFDVVYPSVPKQENLVDCGVFVIMFLTYWTWYCGLCIDFSQRDIDNIRVYLVSNLVCCEHNIANTSPITNYFGPGSFPRVGEIRKSTVQC
ncbi:hypothetical protein ACP70R_002495 [Stipagrostis hirtigluma subsp. patula]